MAVREFTDSSGREWRLWDVTPDELNPRTKDEAFLAQLYYTGWIVFETKAGDEKRRLNPIPRAWHELPDHDLEGLLHKAEIVPKRRLHADGHTSGRVAADGLQHTSEPFEHAIQNSQNAAEIVGNGTADVTDLNVIRTFRYPGGRIWAVCVLLHPGGGQPPLLRFSAGARNIDLIDWPKDWADYPDAELVNLLRRALPRAAGGGLDPHSPRRRWDDVAPS
jgi:hypothetical protein